jgi:hypothetical protein
MLRDEPGKDVGRSERSRDLELILSCRATVKSGLAAAQYCSGVSHVGRKRRVLIRTLIAVDWQASDKWSQRLAPRFRASHGAPLAADPSCWRQGRVSRPGAASGGGSMKGRRRDPRTDTDATSDTRVQSVL